MRVPSTHCRGSPQRTPTSRDLYQNLERAYVALDDLAGARGYLTGLVTETPDNAFAHHALGRIIGDDDQAIDHMTQAIALDRLMEQAYRDLAYFVRKKGEPQLEIDFGNVYVMLGEPEKALEYHRASYELLKRAIPVPTPSGGGPW